MFLILTHPGDRLACRVFDRLCWRRGSGSAILLTPDNLTLGTDWAMRQAGLDVRTEMRLADGSRFPSEDITAVFNRLRFVTVPQFAIATAADRDYAVMEMHAFLLSWLSGLRCPVVNRASPRSLGGDDWSLAEWLLHAGRAGLPTRGIHFTTSARRSPKPGYYALVPLNGAGLSGDATLRPTSKATLGSAPAHFLEPVEAELRRILVIGDSVRGDDLPSLQTEGCLRLARAQGCAFVEFIFARAVADGFWKLCGVNAFPHDLEEDNIAALVDFLESATL